MLGLIINESSIVKEILENNNINEKPSVAISLLVKYFYLKGITDKLMIQEEIIKIMSKCDEDFRRSQWEDNIKKTIKTFFSNLKKYNNEVKMIDIDEIIITKSEIDEINKLDDKKLRKLSFVLLVYAKVTNIILNREDGWINQSMTNIFKEAKVAAKGDDKPLLLHELLRRGYITTSSRVDKTSLKINYVNYDDEPAVTIDDFDGVIYKYLNYMGEKWKRCECCGEWVKANKRNNNKYCYDCKKEKELDKYKKYNTKRK